MFFMAPGLVFMISGGFLWSLMALVTRSTGDALRQNMKGSENFHLFLCSSVFCTYAVFSINVEVSD